MADDVFILGAGVSCDAGAPLMNNFLDISFRLWKYNQVRSPQDFKLVFDAIGELQNVNSKARLEIRNLEDVFSAFSMAQLLGRFGTRNQTDLDNLVNAFRVLIVETIERTMRFAREPGGLASSPAYYDQFSTVIDKLYMAKIGRKVSVITFNYDLAVEHTLMRNGINYTYGLEQTFEANSVKLLKLHGSMNWSKCGKCMKVSSIGWGNAFVLDPTSSHFHLLVSTRLPESKCCEIPLSTPLIVPPTWDKSQYHRDISVVWRAAAKELSEAENIYVLGFSLPETDTFFKYLYALGTLSSNILRRFWVFNPDQNVENRFVRLLGHSALQRFQFERRYFFDACQFLSSNLNV